MSRPLLCLDFDGVCTTYASGWQGIDVCPDPPVAGLGFFLSEAILHFEVHIHSARSSEEAGRDAMKQWFSRHLGQWMLDQLSFPEHKPPAFLTIDDRAMQFTGTWPAVQPLLGFRPWTSNTAPPNERPPEDTPTWRWRTENWTPDETGMEDLGATPPPLSPTAYATAIGGRHCPACGRTDIAGGDEPTLGRQVVTRPLVCEHCGATWTAVYTLSGYEGLRTHASFAPDRGADVRLGDATPDADHA